jgi:uncharacterized protein
MPIVGNWQGTLNTEQGELRLVLHISKAPDGSLSATLDSVDQAANGIPVTAISVKDSKLKLTIDAVHCSCEGTVNKDATEIKGTWSQGPPLDLNFKRMAASLPIEHKPVRPSDIDGAWMGTLDLGGVKLRMVFHLTNTADGLTATADSPDHVAYDNKLQGNRLAGTLTIPSGKGPFAARLADLVFRAPSQIFPVIITGSI